MILGYLIEKEFKQFWRDAFLPKLALAFPLLVMLIFPLVATMDITGIRVDVVDCDRSIASERLIHKIDASTYFTLNAVHDSFAQAMSDIENGSADAILQIPDSFDRALSTGLPVTVHISPNAVNGTKGGLAGKYLTALLGDFNAEIAVAGTDVAPAGVALYTKEYFNPEGIYRNFMIPALMVILLIMMCGFLPALNIVREKESGTIEQMNVSPVKKSSFILAKLIPYWIMGLVVLSLCFLVAWIIYGLLPRGNILTIYAIALLFILTMSGFGLMISNSSSTMQQAMFVMFFFIMIFLLMTGLFTPVSSMPRWAQWIAALNPSRYFIDVMRGVYLKGAGMAQLWPNFAATAGFLLLFNVWAVISYKKQS